MAVYKTMRKDNEILRTSLQSERSSFISHWRDIADFIEPRRGRFDVSDANRGDRRNMKIIDGSATLSARTLSSGMMSGVTSPARPWFRLTTPDPELAEFSSVKDWLHIVATRMTTLFLKSNLYNCLPAIYGDQGKFGTSCMIWEPDTLDVCRGYVQPIGSYCIANDDRLKVCVFQRDFRMTVRQVVMKFAEYKNGQPMWEKFSVAIKNAWDNGNYEMWVDVCHIIKPNDNYNPRRLESEYKKYISIYYERGMGANAPQWGNDANQLLREKGYDFFPVLAPRWATTGEDAYGTDCPGMMALGDVRALQLMQRRKAQAIDKMINPPMVAPSSLKNSRSSIASGDVTYVDPTNVNATFRPAHEVRFPLNELRQDIQETRQIISRAFFEDLFLMLAQSDRRQITAREIDERHEEKLLAVGPVLEQLNQDLLDPIIDNTFMMMEDAGLIPTPPEELKGVTLKIEYISIMAQAQKLIGIGSIDRMMSFAVNLSQANAGILDKIDFDQAADVMGDLLSVVPGIIRTDDQVAQIRGERQEAQAQQAQAEQQAMMAQNAKTLSETNLEGDNALNAVLEQAEAGELA